MATFTPPFTAEYIDGLLDRDGHVAVDGCRSAEEALARASELNDGEGRA